jgi:hypothetical protein
MKDIASSRKMGGLVGAGFSSVAGRLVGETMV